MLKVKWGQKRGTLLCVFRLSLRQQGKTNEIIPKPFKLEMNVLHVHVMLLPVLAGRVACWVKLAMIIMIIKII